MWHIIPDSFRTHWKDWEVRFLVLFSLLLQMILLPVGTRRKATPIGKIHFLVWTAYLTAESIPIMTLGVISNWLSNLKKQSSTGALERKYELIALWAPIVLVHLGGPDSITAYSLEDNELWLRYLARVVVQIGWTCYIYFLALSSSPLSYLAIAIVLVGILKNFERIVSLRRASKDEFRDSLMSPPRSGLLYPRLSESLSLRKGEGGIVMPESIPESRAPASLSLTKYQNLQKPQDRNVFVAYQLFKFFESSFADLIINHKALEMIKSLFAEQMTSKNTFKIIDIELNLMFESQYTKARMVYGTWGAISKAITFVLTLGVLLAFCMVDKRVYELKLDVSITFMVILGLLLSEIHSIIRIISSDRMFAFFIERESRLGYPLVSFIQSNRFLRWFGFTTEGCRWSGSLSQFNLLHLAVTKTYRIFSFNPWIKKRYVKMRQYFSITYQPLLDGLRIWIHTDLKEKVEGRPTNDGSWFPDFGAAKRLRILNHDELIWSTEMQFSQSIVIWHIATELLYSEYSGSLNENGELRMRCEMSRTLSNYLVYLLVHKPSMLPIGIGDNYYAHTLLEAGKAYEVESSSVRLNKSKNTWPRKNYDHQDGDPFHYKSKSNSKHKSQRELDLCRICRMLLDVPYDPDIEPKLVEGEGNQSVLFHASHLAQQLKCIDNPIEQWDMVRIVWTEALLYSAYQSKGYDHAKQLSYGGEFLTHVWLLMAHLGISKQVKSLDKHAFKRLVLW